MCVDIHAHESVNTYFSRLQAGMLTYINIFNEQFLDILVIVLQESILLMDQLHVTIEASITLIKCLHIVYNVMVNIISVLCANAYAEEILYF